MIFQKDILCFRWKYLFRGTLSSKNWVSENVCMSACPQPPPLLSNLLTLLRPYLHQTRNLTIYYRGAQKIVFKTCKIKIFLISNIHFYLRQKQALGNSTVMCTIHFPVMYYSYVFTQKTYNKHSLCIFWLFCPNY